MSPPPSPPSPQRLPVLTEVVELPSHQPLDDDAMYAATEPAPLSDWAPRGSDEPLAMAAPIETPPGIDEDVVAERVLADVERQLDLMFEQRLRESMSPVLARMTDTLVRELRSQLATTLREMVTRAVSNELDRLHKR